MRILVVGGAGFIGSHLCRELDERGHEVTALSRSPEKAVLPDGVRTVAGDVTAYDSIEDAFEGQDAAVNLVALSPLFRPSGGSEMHVRVHKGGTKNVIRAAEKHGVDRVVQLSALGADPDAATAYLRSKGQAEKLLEESDLEWVIFRPSVVFGEGEEFIPYTKRLAPPYVTPLPGGGKTRFQPIWVGDFVPILADGIGDKPDGKTHAGRIYEIGGPEILTLAEVAELAHGADGRPIRVVPIPMAFAAIGLRVLEVIPSPILDAVPGLPRMGTDQYRSLQFDNTVETNDIAAFGRDRSELRTLGEYLESGTTRR